MHSTPTIESLISPHTVDDFFRNYWEKHWLYIERDSDDYFNHVLGARDLDSYFQSHALHPSFIRAIKSGIDVDANKWTRIDKRQNTDLYRVVDIEKLFSHFCEGASLVVNVSEGLIPKLGRFCNSLEQELKIRLQANIYITPPREKGFVLHYDAHDIFILQTGGKKCWKLFGRAPDNVRYGQQTIQDYYKSREPEIELEMKAGDMLYLPAYTVHEVHTTDATSVHVSVGVYARRWFHLLQDLAKSAEQSLDFQQTLPHSFSSDDDKKKFTEQFGEKLRVLLQDLDTATITKNEQSIFARDQFINADGWLSDLLIAERLTLDSIVSRRAGIEFVLQEDSQNTEIKFWNKKLSLPRILKPASELLLGDKPFAVRDIKGLITDKGKLELAIEFVRSGFLTISSI